MQDIRITQVFLREPTPIGPVGARQLHERVVMADAGVTFSEHRAGVLCVRAGQSTAELFPWGAIQKLSVELEEPKKK